MVCAGGLWLQPKLVELNRQRYAPGIPQEDRALVAGRFGRWHGVSQVGNLVVLIGAFAHLLILAHGPPSGRCKGQANPGR